MFMMVTGNVVWFRSDGIGFETASSGANRQWTDVNMTGKEPGREKDKRQDKATGRKQTSARDRV